MLNRDELVSLVLLFLHLLFSLLGSKILNPGFFDEVLESDNADNREVDDHVQDNDGDEGPSELKLHFKVADPACEGE